MGRLKGERPRCQCIHFPGDVQRGQTATPSTGQPTIPLQFERKARPGGHTTVEGPTVKGGTAEGLTICRCRRQGRRKGVRIRPGVVFGHASVMALAEVIPSQHAARKGNRGGVRHKGSGRPARVNDLGSRRRVFLHGRMEHPRNRVVVQRRKGRGAGTEVSYPANQHNLPLTTLYLVPRVIEDGNHFGWSDVESTAEFLDLRNDRLPNGGHVTSLALYGHVGKPRGRGEVGRGRNLPKRGLLGHPEGTNRSRSAHVCLLLRIRLDSLLIVFKY